MRIGRLLVGLALCVGCSKESPAPPAPRDAAPVVIPDAAMDAALPQIEIQAGALQFEVEEADAGPAVAATKPAVARKPARAVRRAAKPKRAKATSARATSAMGTIRANMRDVETCYGRVALKDPSIKGRIVMQWTLDRTGKPSATAILKDTLKDKSVGQCLRKKARAWRFPPPSGGVGVITYPFDLRVQ